MWDLFRSVWKMTFSEIYSCSLLISLLSQSSCLLLPLFSHGTHKSLFHCYVFLSLIHTIEAHSSPWKKSFSEITVDDKDKKSLFIPQDFLIHSLTCLLRAIVVREEEGRKWILIIGFLLIIGVAFLNRVLEKAARSTALFYPLHSTSLLRFIKSFRRYFELKEIRDFHLLMHNIRI